MSREPGGRPTAVISICTSCRPAEPETEGSPGDALLAALRALQDREKPDAIDRGPDIQIRAVQCLSVCKRPCTASLSGVDRYTYVFGDLDPATGAEALLACARTYLETEHGYLLWRERPEPLRRGIVARVPPSGWSQDDGRHPR